MLKERNDKLLDFLQDINKQLERKVLKLSKKVNKNVEIHELKKAELLHNFKTLEKKSFEMDGEIVQQKKKIKLIKGKLKDKENEYERIYFDIERKDEVIEHLKNILLSNKLKMEEKIIIDKDKLDQDLYKKSKKIKRLSLELVNLDKFHNKFLDFFENEKVKENLIKKDKRNQENKSNSKGFCNLEQKKNPENFNKFLLKSDNEKTGWNFFEKCSKIDTEVISKNISSEKKVENSNKKKKAMLKQYREKKMNITTYRKHTFSLKYKKKGKSVQYIKQTTSVKKTPKRRGTPFTLKHSEDFLKDLKKKINQKNFSKKKINLNLDHLKKKFKLQKNLEKSKTHEKIDSELKPLNVDEFLFNKNLEYPDLSDFKEENEEEERLQKILDNNSNLNSKLNSNKRNRSFKFFFMNLHQKIPLSRFSSTKNSSRGIKFSNFHRCLKNKDQKLFLNKKVQSNQIGPNFNLNDANNNERKFFQNKVQKKEFCYPTKPHFKLDRNIYRRSNSQKIKNNLSLNILNDKEVIHQKNLHLPLELSKKNKLNENEIIYNESEEECLRNTVIKKMHKSDIKNKDIIDLENNSDNFTRKKINKNIQSKKDEKINLNKEGIVIDIDKEIISSQISTVKENITIDKKDLMNPVKVIRIDNKDVLLDNKEIKNTFKTNLNNTELIFKEDEIFPLHQKIQVKEKNLKVRNKREFSIELGAYDNKSENTNLFFNNNEKNLQGRKLESEDITKTKDKLSDFNKIKESKNKDNKVNPLKQKNKNQANLDHYKPQKNCFLDNLINFFFQFNQYEDYLD